MRLRLHDKTTAKVGPCSLCRRELKLDVRGRPWAHKCPHGLKCESLKEIGLPAIARCAQCKLLEEKADG